MVAIDPANSQSPIDGRYAYVRMVLSLLLSTIGGIGLWSVVVVIPVIENEFGVDRGSASLPYTATLIGFAVGSLFLGRLSDRYGITVPLTVSAVMAECWLYISGHCEQSVAVCSHSGRYDWISRQFGNIWPPYCGYFSLV